MLTNIRREHDDLKPSSDKRFARHWTIAYNAGMDLNALELFIEIAKSGSFAEAARKLDRDPSQVSRTISALELSLKFQLFKRSTRKLSLTEAGERYLMRVKPVIEDLRDANEEARQLNESPAGLLRITASTAFGQTCLLPLINEFYQRYPEIELELRLSEENLDLYSQDIDLACRLSPSFQSDLVGLRLFDTSYKVVATPEYIKKQSPIAKPSDLNHHQCIVMNIASYRSRWFFKSAGAQISEAKIRSRLAASNALALKECITQGIGPGLIADWLVKKELAKGTLVDLFPQYQVSATDFDTGAWLLYPSRKHLPSKTRVMIEYLKEKFLM